MSGFLSCLCQLGWGTVHFTFSSLIFCVFTRYFHLKHFVSCEAPFFLDHTFSLFFAFFFLHMSPVADVTRQLTSQSQKLLIMLFFLAHLFRAPFIVPSHFTIYHLLYWFVTPLRDANRSSSSINTIENQFFFFINAKGFSWLTSGLWPSHFLIWWWSHFIESIILSILWSSLWSMVLGCSSWWFVMRGVEWWSVC